MAERNPSARPKRAAFSAEAVLGDSGLKRSGGIITEEFLPELRGKRGMAVYREMADNDPVIGAILFAFHALIKNVEWPVQAVDDSPEGEGAKQFLEEVLDDMSTPFSSVIDEVCSMFTYGFAPLEIVWKRRVGPDGEDGATRSRYSDGKIGVRALSLRSQTSIESWMIDENDGSIDGLWQQPPTKSRVFIPIEKMLLFRTTDQRNNPEGRSLLRNAYRPWFKKKRIEDIEGVGVERDLAGLPVARIPGAYFDPSASAEDKAILAGWKRLVTQVRRDQQEGILIPSDRDQNGNAIFDFELLSSGGARALDTTKIIDRYDRRMAMSVLADFMFLGQAAVGSFALSSDKTELFAAALGGFLGSICDVFNRHFVPRLWLINALDPEYMPTVGHGDIEKADLEKLSQFITALTGAGFVLSPDRDLENHLRDEAGFPPAPEDADDYPGDGDLEDEERESDAEAAEDEEPEAAMGKRRRKPSRVRKTFEYDDQGLIKAVIEERED